MSTETSDMPDAALERSISAVREFSRFYTARMGVLREHLLDSGFSLTEARIIYELGQRSPVSATELNRTLNLDPGYVSRLIASLHARKLVTKQRALSDGRPIYGTPRRASQPPSDDHGRSMYKILYDPAGWDTAGRGG